MANSTQVLNTASSARMADVLREALRDAVEVAVSVAFVQMTGLQLLLPSLADARRRGATVRVLTSTYLDVTEPQALRALLAIGGLALRVQQGSQGFHAKVHLLVLRASKVGWVGSSNWSRAGLRDNVEWNTRVDDPAAFDEMWQRFEELWTRRDVCAPDEAFLTAYAKRWAAARIATLAEASTVADGGEGYGTAPTPKPLQRDALQRLAEERAQGVKRALVVAATGVGKTLLAAFDAQAAGAEKILFVAHRQDIVTQAAKEFGRVFGGAFACDVLVEGARPTGRDAVFVTIQALLGSGGRELLAHEWHYVVIDEFHHAEADGWQRALRTLKARFLLGITATPERSDGRNVMDLCDGNVAFEVRLPEAIRVGALLPFHYFGVADDTVDYGAIPKNATEAQLGAALSLATRAELVLAHAIEKGYDGVKRVAVAFCAGVRHAEFMRAEFEKRGQRAAVVHGETDLAARRKIYDDLQDPTHPLQWLFVADVLNEGVDLPAINTVLFLRPTESSVLFLQQLGRGLRKHPGTEVLTVIDLVGLHRGAYEAFYALHDEHAAPTQQSRTVSSVLAAPITPPEGCEILLDDMTLAVLARVRSIALRGRALAEATYKHLRAQIGRPPLPLDGMRVRALTLSDVRRTHGGWRELRIAMGDADPWEMAVEADGPLDALLRLTERNYLLQRVDGYAALWASLDGDADLAPAYARFFEAHPQWSGEHKPHAHAQVVAALVAVLARADQTALWSGDRWVPSLRTALQSPDVRASVRARLAATLASDYQLRHGGVLRTPASLQRFAAYARHEIVNHFGVQYDPTVHNLGVIRSTVHAGHVMLLARVDTSNAKAEHQYENRVLDRTHVAWASQNKMTPDNKAGRIIAKQKEDGVTLHLFMAPGSHTPYRYLGAVRVESHQGSAPMQVRFALPEALPDAVYAELTDATT